MLYRVSGNPYLHLTPLHCFWNHEFIMHYHGVLLDKATCLWRDTGLHKCTCPIPAVWASLWAEVGRELTRPWRRRSQEAEATSSSLASLSTRPPAVPPASHCSHGVQRRWWTWVGWKLFCFSIWWFMFPFTETLASAWLRWFLSSQMESETLG